MKGDGDSERAYLMRAYLARPEDEQITIYKRLTHTSIAPESAVAAGGGGATGSRYKDRRLLAFYFDMTAMPPADQQRALSAAEKFIRTQMTEADLVSILRFGGGSVDVLQDFTADRNRLLCPTAAAIARIMAAAYVVL